MLLLKILPMTGISGAGRKIQMPFDIDASPGTLVWLKRKEMWGVQDGPLPVSRWNYKPEKIMALLMVIGVIILIGVITPFFKLVGAYFGTVFFLSRPSYTWTWQILHPMVFQSVGGGIHADGCAADQLWLCMSRGARGYTRKIGCAADCRAGKALWNAT